MTRAPGRFSELRRSSAVLAALSACLAAGMSAGAYAAAPADDVPAVTVAYGDLNLATAHGTEVLYGRIVSAARQVCAADQVDIRNLHALALVRTCEAQAIERAVHEVNSPRLAALYNARLRHG